MKGIKVMGVNLHDDNGDSRQENLWQISSYFCGIGWHSVSLRKVSNIGGKVFTMCTYVISVLVTSLLVE